MLSSFLAVQAAQAAYVFKLAPAALPSNQALNLVNSSDTSKRATTWGGSPVVNPKTGIVHLYASSFHGACGLSSWETNSYVRHASSTRAGGPFTPLDAAIPSYAHNPEVVYSSFDKRFLLFTLGGQNASAPVPCANFTPTAKWGGAGPPPWLSEVRLHTSLSPQGPWLPLLTQPNRSSNATGRQTPVMIATGLNANPTAWVDPMTGEVTLLHGMFDKPHSPHKRRYVIQRAKSWRG